MVRALPVAARAEAVTYLVLLAAVAHHRLLEGADRIRPLGLLHGVVFLIYLVAVLAARRRRSWSPQDVVVMLAAAFAPWGTVVAERRLRPAKVAS